MFSTITLFLKTVRPQTWMNIFIGIVIAVAICFLVFKVEQYGEANQAALSAKTIAAQQKTIDNLTAQINDANAIYAQQLHDNDKQHKEWQTKLKDAKDESAKEISATKATSAITTIINSQLRQSLTTTQIKLSSLPDTAGAKAARDEYTAVLSTSFAECTAAYQDMADLATGYQIDAKLLYDGWPISNPTPVSSDNETPARTDTPPSTQ